MIQILPDKFIIEIDSSAPVEDAYYLKMALLDVIEDVAIVSEDMNNGLFYLQNIARLLKEMEYEPQQIEKAFIKDDELEKLHKEEINSYKKNISEANKRAEASERHKEIQNSMIDYLAERVEPLKKSLAGAG